MADVYFTAAYGRVPLLITEISTPRGRDISVQSPANGDRHKKYDRGLRDRPSDVEILFVDQPGLASYLERYDEFVRLAEIDLPQIFTHPLDGSFRAKCGPIEVRATAQELCVRVRCTIFPVQDFEAVFPTAAGTSAIVGGDAVTAAAAKATAELAALGMTSDAIADCSSEATRWEESEDLSTQDVLVTVQALTTRIDESTAELELAADLARWPAYKAMVSLRYSVVRAAQALTSTASALFEVFVDRPRPLRAICAEVFGSRDAEDQTVKVAKLNRIRTPGLVPQGTTLKMPSPRASA